MVRLQGTADRAEALTKPFSDTELGRRKDDKWSVKEHIGHLIDLETLHDWRLSEFLQKKEVLTAADISNKKTYKSNHNAKSIKQLLAEFRVGRTVFLDRLYTMNEDMITQAAKHPRLKQSMRLIDNAFFVAEHDDHHLAIVNLILRGR